jgi:hypothetical protein
MPIIEKNSFWSKVNKRSPNGCWEWTGAINTKTGYGAFRTGGKLYSAHRFAWQATHGNIDGGLCVCHTCDNRKCVNPNHLFIGTKLDNYQDAKAKGKVSYPPRNIGDLHPMRKLSSTDVANIRAKFSTGRYSKAALSREFGVSDVQINNVIIRKHWKGV